MPRYVLLQHDHPAPHYDLMLEAGAILRTWRLPQLPVINESVPADALGDHRLLYLDYEGPVSGGRGCVTRWDAGTFAWEENTTEVVVIRLHGQRLRGRLILEQHSAGTWTCRLVE